MQQQVERINYILAQHLWCDFEVVEWGQDLIIEGYTDFKLYSSGPQIRVIFKNIFYAQLRSEWQTDTSRPAFTIPDDQESYQLNSQYQIEQGYYWLKIQAEDIGMPFLICMSAIEIEEKLV